MSGGLSQRAIRRLLARRAKRSRQYSQHHSQRSRTLSILLGAALTIPGLGLQSVSAQSATEDFETRIKFTEYRDDQEHGSRMRVHAPVVWLKGPAGNGAEFEGSVLYESISGASPLYLSTLSGASGVGIEDKRSAGDLSYTKYFDNLSVGVGAAISDEDDYESKGGSLTSRAWTSDKNTVFQAGVGANFDSISSTIDPDLDEERDTQNYLLGVTQVINEISVVQCNLTYESGDGYYSDPYKPFDHRPESRERWAAAARYNRYFADYDAALHADYRFYWDTYDVNSHTVELSWYQPIGEFWLVRPNVRYYSQHEADFFQNGRFPLKQPTEFFSADQRLASFGELGGGIRFERLFQNGLSFDATFQVFQQRAGFKLGSYGSSGIEPFTGWYVMLGMAKRF